MKTRQVILYNMATASYRLHTLTQSQLDYYIRTHSEVMEFDIMQLGLSVKDPAKMVRKLNQRLKKLLSIR